MLCLRKSPQELTLTPTSQTKYCGYDSRKKIHRSLIIIQKKEDIKNNLQNEIN